MTTTELLRHDEATSDHDLIQSYLSDCRLRGHSPETIRSNKSTLRITARYMKQQGFSLLEVDKYSLKGLLDYLKNERRVTHKTVEGYFTTLSSFYEYLVYARASVSLGNPRNFTKTKLSKMGRTVSQKLETGKQNADRRLPFLKHKLPETQVIIALSHENNNELAQVGDAVLSLVIKEHYYKQKVSAEKIQCKNEELGNNDYLAKIAVEKLKLPDLIQSSSGLRYNPEKNEVYARTLEAIIGAIYQDNKLEAAREFIEKWIIPQSETYSIT